MERKRSLPVTVVVMVCLLGVPVYAKYGGGSGTAEDPYQISTAEEMQTIGAEPNDWDKHFKLMADVDLAEYTGQDFNIIGNQAFPFSGVFDGNGHTISNFNYIAVTDNTGLFGYVSGASAQIRDLGLVDPKVEDDEGVVVRIGSLLGYLNNGIVTNCYVENGSVGTIYAGGLVGCNSGAIVNCTASAIVGGRWVGCLVGYNDGGISECSSSGEARGHWYPGGLVGWNSGVIFKCYSSSDVTPDHHGGGLVGRNDGTIINCHATGSLPYSHISDWGRGNGGLVGLNAGMISNCYSVGHRFVRRYVQGGGGLVGYDEGGTVTASFWDTETSGLVTSDGGIGKTAGEMKQQATFEDWDFINVWDIGEGQTYPFLRTHSAGDVNKDGVVDFVDLCVVAETWMQER